MHRVELKVVKVHNLCQWILVPNAPCGVESIFYMTKEEAIESS